jgi:4-hydroxybenzoate polyprenyltransferase
MNRKQAESVTVNMTRVSDYVRIARPDHWIKQMLVVPGILLALIALEPNSGEMGAIMDAGDTIASLGSLSVSFSLFATIILVLLATSLIASANYVINEWLDAEFDRYHPTKHRRSAVAVGLQKPIVLLEWTVLSLAGMVMGWFISLTAFICLIILWVMGILYNVRPFRTKDIPYLDVLTESLNNALRLLIGWFAVAPMIVPPSSIVIGYWMAGAFLMAAKRLSEYRMFNDHKQAGLYRKSFCHYSEKRLLISMFFYAMLAVFLCGTFLIKYHIEYLLAMPFFCGLFCLYVWLSFKADSAAQKPEKLFRERGLIAYVLVFVALLIALTFARLPALQALLQTSLIGM